MHVSKGPWIPTDRALPRAGLCLTDETISPLSVMSTPCVTRAVHVHRLLQASRCCHYFHCANKETGWEKLNHVPEDTWLVSGGAQPDQVGLTTRTTLHAKGQRWVKRRLKTDIPEEDWRFPTCAASLKAGAWPALLCLP